MSPPVESESQPKRNYVRRMRRIRLQTQELMDLGLVSSRQTHIGTSQKRSRVTTTEFWGEKAKLRLIQQLGCIEAYRELETRKAIQRSDASVLRLSANSTPKRQTQVSSLRRSCPTSPTCAEPLPRLLRTPSAYQQPRIHTLHWIMEECDQLLSRV